ncbi:MAG TPA: class I SAM-dependent methyltransferase [Herpetosiphonaceae bacterium]
MAAPVASAAEPAVAPDPSRAEADRALLERLLSNEADPAYRRRALRLLADLELRDGDTVLDGGCGYGFYALAMTALRRLTVVALDTDRARLREAGRSVSEARLAAGDMARLPCADAAFDKILLSEVLEHLPDDAAALRELWRVARPGATLALSVPHANYPAWWDPINKLNDALGRPPLRRAAFGGIWEHHQRLYTPERLRAALAAAGWRIERCEEATHYALPCVPYLVYGLGKPLLERGLLPAAWRRRADRLRGLERPAGADPFSLARRLIYWADRRNDGPAPPPGASFVNILVKARKVHP